MTLSRLTTGRLTTGSCWGQQTCLLFLPPDVTCSTRLLVQDRAFPFYPALAIQSSLVLVSSSKGQFQPQNQKPVLQSVLVLILTPANHGFHFSRGSLLPTASVLPRGPGNNREGLARALQQPFSECQSLLCQRCLVHVRVHLHQWSSFRVHISHIVCFVLVQRFSSCISLYEDQK